MENTAETPAEPAAPKKRSVTGRIMRFCWKTVKYTFITVFVLLLSIIIAFQFSSVQTWAAQKGSDWLSEELKTKVSIEKVKISFFSSVVLKGVYMEDLHKDTLLYGGDLDVQILDFSIKKQFLNLNTITLRNVNAKVLKYEKEEDFNFQFIANYFASADTTPKTDSSTFLLDYGKFVLDNVNLTYQDKNDTTKVSGMNYSNIRLNGLSGMISGINLSADTIRLNVANMRMREQCGLHLKRLDALLKIAPDHISADSLWLETEHTYLHGSLSLRQDSYDDFSDFVNKVNMKIQLKDSSKIGTQDIAYLVPDVKGINETVYFSGKIRGTVNELSGSKISLKYGKNTEYNGDFSISDVTDPEKFYLHFDIRKLNTNYNDLMTLRLPQLKRADQSNMFEPVRTLGFVNFKGQIDGFLSDIAAKGTLRTGIGTLITDVGVSNIGSKDKTLAYHGKVKTSSFNVGKMLKVPDLETVTADIKLEGKGTDINKDLWAKLSGNISQIRYNNYNYERVSINGEFKDKKFDGKFELKDPNADIDFYGNIKLNNKVPDMDFIATINKFDLTKLHFVNSKDSVNSLSSQIAINLKGDNANNLTGRINFDNTEYHLNSKVHRLSTFDLILEQDKPEKTIRLNSGIADVKIEGAFNVTDLPNCFRQYLEKYFPTMIKERKIPKDARYTDNFNYTIKIKKIKSIAELYMPDLRIAFGTTLKGMFDARSSQLSMNGRSDSIRYKTYLIKDWFVEANSLTNSIDITTGMQKALITDSLYLSNFAFNTSSFDNVSKFGMLWDNKSKLRNSGDMNGKIVFSDKDLDLHFDKLEIFIADSCWKLNDSTDHITLDTTGFINLRHLRFENQKQLIAINGAISKDPEKDLEVELQNFKLAQLNPLIKSAQLKLQGSLSGKARISDIMNKVIFTSDFDFSNLLLNDKKLGNGKLRSIYDASHEVVSLDGYFSKGLMNVNTKQLINNIEFTGYYYPSKKENNIDVTAKLKGLDITMAQPYVKDILTFSKGFVEGTLDVKGSVSKPLITGKLDLQSVNNMKVDYLNTYYSINGTIKIYPDRIQFGDDTPTNLSEPNPIHIFDKDNSEATLWGNIFHDNFKVTKLDFDINAKNLMVLNTNGANNPSYYGRAYVTGTVGIYGDLDYMNMDINLKTEKKTVFNIPLSGPATVDENDFIIFVDADSTKKDKHDYKNTLSGLNLNFNLEATPDALVQLIFDSKSGDVIQAKGAGSIAMKINTTGKFEMYGLYSLTDGNYLFSLENVISKKFDIENGSTIKWTGDPLNADINITANYTGRAKLTPFFPSDSTGMYNKPTQASVMLYMRDKLLTPDITFGVKLPTADETTRQTVMSYINNEQELNRQVFSFLILKSFVTPLQLSNAGVGVGAGSAASATSSEMLSNQISNWLSQLSTNVDISVNLSPEQMELALSKQLFDDRLSINGEVGVNNNSGQKTSNMIGDIMVDYKVYPDGKLRIKGFNKSNDNTQVTTQGGPFTQGMGVFYREEFNTIDELFDRYLSWLGKKKKKT